MLSNAGDKLIINTDNVNCVMKKVTVLIEYS